PAASVRERPLWLRLHQQSAAPDQADDPQGRRAESVARRDRPVQPVDAFPRSHMGGGARPRRLRFEENPRPRRLASAGRFRLRQVLQRRSLSVPETGAGRLRHQQRRPLHAAVSCVVGGGAARRRRFRRGIGLVQRVQEFRRHHRDRRQPDREPSGRRHLLQAGGQARRQVDRDGSARAGAQAPRLENDAVQERRRRGHAQRHAQRHRHREAVRPAIHPDLRRGLRALRREHKDFTPEEMEPICGIPADTLREVARTYARAESAIIFWGMGVSQHTHGTDNARCLIALALITGQIGRLGTGLHPLRGQNNVQGASDAGLIPMFFPDYKSVENPEIRAKVENLWNTKLDPKRGLTVVEIMDAVHADVIKGMYIMGENPAMSDPDLNHARGALAHLEHLVVQDIFLTETASYADVILPASAWPEKDGTVTNTNRQVQMGRQALPLPGEARQDLWIIQDLAQRIGCNWNYKLVGEVFTEMAAMMPSLDNIPWDRVERESAVTYPADAI